MNWRIYYGDGTTFSSADGDPADAPGGGVAVIVGVDDGCGWIARQGDFYVYDADLFDGWQAVDVWGLVQYVMRPGHKVIKLGETIGSEQFKAILTRAREDLGNKSAWKRWERRPDGW